MDIGQQSSQDNILNRNNNVKINDSKYENHINQLEIRNNKLFLRKLRYIDKDKFYNILNSKNFILPDARFVTQNFITQALKGNIKLIK